MKDQELSLENAKNSYEAEIKMAKVRYAPIEQLAAGIINWRAGQVDVVSEFNEAQKAYFEVLCHLDYAEIWLNAMNEIVFSPGGKYEALKEEAASRLSAIIVLKEEAGRAFHTIWDRAAQCRWVPREGVQNARGDGH